MSVASRYSIQGRILPIEQCRATVACLIGQIHLLLRAGGTPSPKKTTSGFRMPPQLGHGGTMKPFPAQCRLLYKMWPQRLARSAHSQIVPSQKWSVQVWQQGLMCLPASCSSTSPSGRLTGTSTSPSGLRLKRCACMRTRTRSATKSLPGSFCSLACPSQDVYMTAFTANNHSYRFWLPARHIWLCQPFSTQLAPVSAVQCTASNKRAGKCLLSEGVHTCRISSSEAPTRRERCRAASASCPAATRRFTCSAASGFSSAKRSWKGCRGDVLPHPMQTTLHRAGCMLTAPGDR